MPTGPLASAVLAFVLPPVGDFLDPSEPSDPAGTNSTSEAGFRTVYAGLQAWGKATLPDRLATWTQGVARDLGSETAKAARLNGNRVVANVGVAGVILSQIGVRFSGFYCFERFRAFAVFSHIHDLVIWLGQQILNDEGIKFSKTTKCVVVSAHLWIQRIATETIVHAQV